ncbi:MBL fold metallo-hydrolase [Brevibacillus sp. NRS-1366]|uniref:MBL fold metallo-hydrolase n=1 Tax=Brevibacillus sp. NRS-1366 TaxID=3233899 RepID=UPI003D20C30E
MKVEQVSEHIWCIRSWLLIPVRVWVVIEQDGVTLVDAGMPFMAIGILKAIDGLGAGPLKQILLTHGHSDHVGAVQKIMERKSTPLYAHRIEIPYMEGEQLYPGRKKRERNVQPGLAKPLPETEDKELASIAGLRPYLTPGHSPGHVVYYHEKDRVLLAGDLFTSKRGRLYRPMPMFTADMAGALKSSLIIRKLQPKHLEVCHGNSVKNPAEQLDAYLQETATSYSIPAGTWQ